MGIQQFVNKKLVRTAVLEAPSNHPAPAGKIRGRRGVCCSGAPHRPLNFMTKDMEMAVEKATEPVWCLGHHAVSTFASNISQARRRVALRKALSPTPATPAHVPHVRRRKRGSRRRNQVRFFSDKKTAKDGAGDRFTDVRYLSADCEQLSLRLPKAKIKIAFQALLDDCRKWPTRLQLKATAVFVWRNNPCIGSQADAGGDHEGQC